MNRIITYLVIGLCVISSAILLSCSRPADKLREDSVPVGEYIFSAQDVQAILITNGISMPFSLTDESYVAPTLEWLERQYSDKLTKFLFDYNIHHWTKESADCDDISRAAAVKSSILFHNSKNRVKGVGLLFGEYHYLKTGLNGHAINIAIVKDKEIYRLVFYDPQVKYIVSLQGKEIGNTIWGRF